MDDKEKIYLLQNSDGDRLVVTKTIDFSHLSRLRDITALRDDDWVSLHITDRTVTFGGRTFNLQNKQVMQVKVPNTFFGQQKAIEE